MTCRDLAAQVVAYLDGELDDARASACRGHLRTCAACRTLADQHARLRDALGALPAPEPPAMLWTRINAELSAAEIADSERGAARWAWARLWAWLRPVAWPVAVVASAGAIALAVVQLRQPPRERLALAVAAVAPVAPADAAPSPVALTRDAADERDAAEAAADARFRAVAAELLTMARGEVATWSPARATQFAREVLRREKAVLAAAPGRARERAWHDLTAYLERVALGEQVAAIGGSR